MLPFEVTTGLIDDSHYNKLSSSLQNAIQQEYLKISKDPQAAVVELEKLVAEHPEVPTLWNYLTMGYARTRNRSKMEKVIRETYEKFPDYLFAMTSYGQLCLENNEISKIPEIFKKKYSLPELFPDRYRFHLTEAIAFYQLLGSFFCRIGQYKLAKDQWHILEKISPHSAVAQSLHEEIEAIIQESKHHKHKQQQFQRTS